MITNNVSFYHILDLKFMHAFKGYNCKFVLYTHKLIIGAIGIQFYNVIKAKM